MKYTCFFVLFLGFWATTWGQTPQQRMQSANEAYQRDDFATAIREYEALVSEGFFSVALYHNLGNAYYKIGQPGRAARYFHRGLRLRPGDKGLQDNLALIRASFDDPITPLPDFFLFRFWKRTQLWLGTNGWASVGLILIWLGFAGLWRWRAAPEREQRKRAFLIGLISLLLSGLPLGLSWSAHRYQHDARQAVVVEEAISFHQGADAQSPVLRDLPPGVTFRVLDQIGAWYKVRLVNGDTGWVKEGGFIRV